MARKPPRPRSAIPLVTVCAAIAKTKVDETSVRSEQFASGWGGKPTERPSRASQTTPPGGEQRQPSSLFIGGDRTHRFLPQRSHCGKHHHHRLDDRERAKGEGRDRYDPADRKTPNLLPAWLPILRGTSADDLLMQTPKWHSWDSAGCHRSRRTDPPAVPRSRFRRSPRPKPRCRVRRRLCPLLTGRASGTPCTSCRTQRDTQGCPVSERPEFHRTDSGT